MGRPVLAFRKTAHCAGLRVRALRALMPVVAAMVRANWRYICPAMPGRKAVGRKTDISTSVMPMTGPVISSIALMVASRGGRCSSSMTRWAFSVTTMASSTTIPMANTRPKSVSTLMENPIAAMTRNVPMSDTGTVVTGITARVLPFVPSRPRRNACPSPEPARSTPQASSPSTPQSPEAVARSRQSRPWSPSTPPRLRLPRRC